MDQAIPDSLVFKMANGGNPNANPKCGSQISIHSPVSGQTIQATVVDT